MNEELSTKLDGLVKKIKTNKNVTAIYLFGSQVTGRARQDSDVDIAVILKNPTWKEEYNISYNDGLFDVHAFSRLPLIIKFRIFSEGKLLFLRDKNYVADVCLNAIKYYRDFEPFFHRFCMGVISNV